MYWEPWAIFATWTLGMPASFGHRGKLSSVSYQMPPVSLLAHQFLLLLLMLSSCCFCCHCCALKDTRQPMNTHTFSPWRNRSKPQRPTGLGCSDRVAQLRKRLRRPASVITQQSGKLYHLCLARQTIDPEGAHKRVFSYIAKSVLK